MFLSQEKKSDEIYKIAFYIFLLIFATFLIYTTFKINISEDETYTLNTTSRNFQGVINQSYKFEAQPPAYFILMSWWRKINSGIFFTKLFSVIFIGFSAIAFYKLVQLFVPKRNSCYYLVAIFLLNPFVIWAAMEIRLYAFLLFLSTTAIYLFFHFQFKKNKQYLYALIIISFVGIYTQYFFTFLLLTFSLIVLITNGWKCFFKFCLYLLPLFFLFLPNFIFLQDQISIQKSHNVSHFPISTLYAILYTPQNFLLATNLVPSVWLNRIIRLVFILAFLFMYLKLRRVDLHPENLFLRKYNYLLFALGILIVLFFFSFLLTGVSYEPKYMTVSFPFFILLFSLFDLSSKFVKPVAYIVTIIYFIILLSIKYWNPVKTYDFKSVARFIEKIEKTNEPILIYRPALALPLNYYYEGPNKMFPIPHPVNFDSSYLINLKDTFELRNAIENAGHNSKRFILISDTTVYEGNLNMHRRMVSNYIYSHYKVSLDTLFYGRSRKKPLRVLSFERRNN